jgi:hypothetical protein
MIPPIFIMDLLSDLIPPVIPSGAKKLILKVIIIAMYSTLFRILRVRFLWQAFASVWKIRENGLLPGLILKGT